MSESAIANRTFTYQDAPLDGILCSLFLSSQCAKEERERFSISVRGESQPRATYATSLLSRCRFPFLPSSTSCSTTTPRFTSTTMSSPYTSRDDNPEAEQGVFQPQGCVL